MAPVLLYTTERLIILINEINHPVYVIKVSTRNFYLSLKYLENLIKFIMFLSYFRQ